MLRIWALGACGASSATDLSLNNPFKESRAIMLGTTMNTWRRKLTVPMVLFLFFALTLPAFAANDSSAINTTNNDGDTANGNHYEN